MHHKGVYLLPANQRIPTRYRHNLWLSTLPICSRVHCFLKSQKSYTLPSQVMRAMIAVAPNIVKSQNFVSAHGPSGKIFILPRYVCTLLCATRNSGLDLPLHRISPRWLALAAQGAIPLPPCALAGATARALIVTWLWFKRSFNIAKAVVLRGILAVHLFNYGLHTSRQIVFGNPSAI